MSWLICGTIPDNSFPLLEGPCTVRGDTLHIGNTQIGISRGTAALAAAASLTTQVLGTSPPRALLCGDIGDGAGSRRLYQHLVDSAADRNETGITFHYLFPDVDWHNRVFWALESMSPKPFLAADAGYMYVAKMSGFAPSYDLFTPDVGELAFLADDQAPHPFYTRGFLLQNENACPELIQQAYTHENAAKNLLVKGKVDWIVSEAVIMHTISEPAVEAMEAIGGTGDSLTGLATAFLSAGCPTMDACFMAAIANRLMGCLSNPTPAFSISRLLTDLPRTVEYIWNEFSRRHPGPAECGVI